MGGEGVERTWESSGKWVPELPPWVSDSAGPGLIPGLFCGGDSGHLRKLCSLGSSPKSAVPENVLLCALYSLFLSFLISKIVKESRSEQSQSSALCIRQCSYPWVRDARTAGPGVVHVLGSAAPLSGQPAFCFAYRNYFMHSLQQMMWEHRKLNLSRSLKGKEL